MRTSSVARPARPTRGALLRALAALVLAACAVGEPAREARDPASASAPAGRLAGPPPSLRAGAVTYPDLPAARTQPPKHDHHHHGAPAPTPAEHDHGAPAEKPTPVPAEHDHGAPAKKSTPAKKPATTKKPTPAKKPAEHDHHHHHAP